MTPFLFLLAVFIAFFVGKKFWQQKKTIRQEQKDYRRLRPQGREGAQKVVAYLNKAIALICLEEDGKVYGHAYKNEEPVGLPHNEGCACSYVPFKAHLEAGSKEAKAQTYPSDLGDLSFKEYKFYKYALYQRLSQDADQKNLYQELQENLKVDAHFKEKVEAHLSAAPLKGGPL